MLQINSVTAQIKGFENEIHTTKRTRVLVDGDYQRTMSLRLASNLDEITELALITENLDPKKQTTIATARIVGNKWQIEITLKGKKVTSTEDRTETKRKEKKTAPGPNLNLRTDVATIIHSMLKKLDLIQGETKPSTKIAELEAIIAKMKAELEAAQKVK